MNLKVGESRETDVTGAGYEFVSNKRQKTGTLEDYVKTKHTREKKYLDFVLAPDFEEPVRMPSDFTYPTNLLSYKNNFQLTVNTDGSFIGYFAPQNNLLLAGGTLNVDYCNYQFLSKTSAAVSYQTQSYTTGQSTTGYTGVSDAFQSFPYKGQFDTARVIGGICTITYIGALQNQSGVVNIGADLVPMTSKPVGSFTPPTNSQLYNLLLFKKYPASETTRSVWFPVDPTCQEFVGVGGPLATNSVPDFSMLVFYFNGYGLPVGSVLDITVDVYYEAIPNVSYTNLFVASQGTSKERKEDAWDEIMSVGKKNLGQILITGAKTVADWLGGPIGNVANKALSWLAS